MWSRGLPWIRRAGGCPSDQLICPRSSGTVSEKHRRGCASRGLLQQTGVPPGTPLGGAGSGRIHHVLVLFDAASVSAPHTQHLIVEKSEAP